MRLPTQLITTFLVLASASADVARGQWTAPTAAYPPVAIAPIAANSYYAGSTVYVAGTANSVAPTTVYAPTAVYAPAASYAPAATPFYGFAPVSRGPQIVSNGAYQAQRPAYIDNPSVYTGLPAMGTIQTSYRPQVPTAPIGNVNLTAPAAPITAPTVISPPMTSYPVTAPAPQREGCLGRFCRKLFGTGYTTSYYRAPVTYYRPVTTLNAVSGTTVTVQQPCTAYEQQMQRNPFTTVLPGTTGSPTNNCQPGCGYPTAINNCNTVPGFRQTTTYGQALPYGSSGINGIGQVGATGSGDLQAMPIPSIPPAGVTYSQPTSPNLSPLTGPPPTLAAPISPTGIGTQLGTETKGNDLSPVGRPTLNKPATSEAAEEAKTPNATDQPDNSDKQDSARWKLQSPADSTAMIPQHMTTQNESDPVSYSRNYGAAEPIRAPTDYVAPYSAKRNGIEHGEPAAPAIYDPVAPPPASNPFPSAAPHLPRSEVNLSDWTEFTNTPARPVRSAAYTTRKNAVQANLAAPTVKRSRYTKWTSIPE